MVVMEVKKRYRTVQKGYNTARFSFCACNSGVIGDWILLLEDFFVDKILSSYQFGCGAASSKTRRINSLVIKSVGFLQGNFAVYINPTIL